MPGPIKNRMEKRISSLERTENMPTLMQLSSKIRDMKEKKTKLSVDEIEGLMVLYAKSGKEIIDRFKKIRKQNKDQVSIETCKKLIGFLNQMIDFAKQQNDPALPILQSIKSRPKAERDAIVYGLSDYANGLWTAEYTIHMKMAAEMDAKANKKRICLRFR